MIRNRFSCYCILCAILGLALVWLLFVTPTIALAQPKGPVSFINDVAPILQKNCFACHDAKKKKGKLDMTSWETFRTGGSKFDPIKAGKSSRAIMLGPSLSASSGRGCVSRNRPSQPAATAARARYGTMRRSPPERSPMPPGICTL